jgi:IclR family mhp operon transcriptional activator
MTTPSRPGKPGKSAPRAPVARALAVVEALNRAPVMHVGEIAEAAGLPKSSAVRLLAQLAEAGYAERLSRAAGWRATSRVLALSSGFRMSDLVTEAARAPMRRFTARHRWAVFLGVPEGHDMLVRYGTVAESPLAVDAFIPDVQTPFLLSALGQAWLAFAPAAEREAVLARLALSRRASDRLARDRADLDRMLARVRKRGYSITDEATRRITKNVARRALEGRKRATGLAVPILAGERILGALSLRYFRSSLSDEEAARLYLEPLRELAVEIGEGVAKNA